MTPHNTLDNNIAGEVVLPILDVYDLGPEIEDKRRQLPSEIQAKLMPWEKIVYFNKPVIVKPTKAPSTLKELMRLTGVSSVDNIGENGASIASISSEENSDVEALTKFEVAHGRDALQVAMDLYPWHPKLLASTIELLATEQGDRDEKYIEGQPFRQEETGRIMLLNRNPEDELGRRFSEKRGWGWPFYGSVDGTPSFILAIARYVSQPPVSDLESYEGASILLKTYEGRDKQGHTVAEAFFGAVHWLLKKTEATNQNPEGLLEFKNKAPKGGMLNQSWKDSDSAYVHENGDWANHNFGIASVEVQSRAYDALLDAARIYSEHLGNTHLAKHLENRAKQLKIQVLSKFWTEEKGGYFVLGTDRDENGRLRQMKVRSSNMGHMLNSQILMDDDPQIIHKKEALIRSLFTPELLSPHGIRTLASDETAFRKEGYHTGSVWLWDNDYIAQGLEKHGYYGLANHLRQCTLNNVNHTNAFPEFVQGDSNSYPTLNQMEIYVYDTRYKALYLFEQLPQEIQAWSVSAVLATKYKYNLPKRATDPLKRELEDELLESIAA